MLMKSSISFSKNTLFSQSVSSASISSVWRRIESGGGRRCAANRFPPASFPSVLSLTGGGHLRRWLGTATIRAASIHFQGIPANVSGIRMSCAGPRRFFPVFPARFFAVPQTASGSLGNRDLGAVRPVGPVSSAESCHEVLRDAEAAHPPAIPRAQSWRRSDTWLPPAEKPFHCIVPSCCLERGVTGKTEREILCGGRRDRDKFIARDFRGNAHPAILGGLDTHNLAQATDIYIARLRDLLRKSDHEFNFVANFEIGIRKEVQPTVTDITRLRIQFVSF